jgi:hypothetical protein
MLEFLALTKHRIRDVLLQSLRPMQLMLAVAAFEMVTFIIRDHLYPSSIATSITFMNNEIHPVILSISFIIYGAATLYNCLSVEYHVWSQRIRYSSAIVGIILWSFAFAAAMLVGYEGTSLLHLGPVCAEAWVLAQLMSNLRELDRRKI